MILVARKAELNAGMQFKCVYLVGRKAELNAGMQFKCVYLVATKAFKCRDAVQMCVSCG